MKTITKISYSLLLAVALVFSLQVNSSASTNLNASESFNPMESFHSMGNLNTRAVPIVPSTDPDTKTTWYQESGTFRINSGSLQVRNSVSYNSPTVATYGAGESFNYEYIVEVRDFNHGFTNRYASYTTASGIRRYVWFMTGGKKIADYTVY